MWAVIPAAVVIGCALGFWALGKTGAAGAPKPSVGPVPPAGLPPPGRAASAAAPAVPPGPASNAVFFTREPLFDPAFLHRARSEFAWVNPPLDPAIPESRQLALVTRVISTLAPPRAQTRDGREPLPTGRGTLPFLLQFAGPVRPEWLQAVSRAGGVLRGYMPVNGWMVELTPAALDRVAALPEVRWAGPYEPGDKIHPFLKHLIARFPGDPRRIEATIDCFDPRDAAVVAAWLKDRGLSIRSAEARSASGRVRARVALDTIPELARLGEVQGIEEYIPPVLHNDKAVLPEHMNATSTWFRYELTGRGQIVGHADSGLDIGSTNGIHPDFAGRILAAYALGRSNDWSDAHSHGTHTAGSILGNGSLSGGQYRGLAWEAKLVHQSVMAANGSLSGLPGNLEDLFAQTYTNGARIHSDSWGSSSFGQYTADSRDTDSFMWDHPDMLVVFSAGNDGIDNVPANGVVDPDSMGDPGTAKNVLTVGAMENDRPSSVYGYTWRKYGASAWPSDYPANPIYNDYISYSYTTSPYRQGMAAFSSRGPTDDGRIKPDVAAPGTDIISCRSRAASGAGWGVAANTNYLYMGGTSMATPLTAGAVALVRQYLVDRAGCANPSAALLKAVLIGGARSMNPGQYGTGAYREIPAASPNGVEGFGQVDVASAVYPTGLSVRILDGQTLATGTILTNTFTVAAAQRPLAVVLAWTDYRGTVGSGITLMNDLDLTLEDPTGGVAYANAGTNFDRLNNVEAIRLTNAPAGIYKARIIGYNVPYDTQRCALVIRAAMEQAPELRHTPPIPVLLATNACPISALVTWYAPLTNGEVRLYWTTNAPGGLFKSIPLVWNGGHEYTNAIPAQPLGAVVHYYLSATVSVYGARYPADAPASLRQVVFSGPPVSLTIAGTRTNSTVVAPTYGLYSYPSGFVVRVTAEPVCTSGTTWRFVNEGWTGSGTVPGSESSAASDVKLADHAVLTWRWREEARLTENSSPAGAVDRSSWHANTSFADTTQAWEIAWDVSTNPPAPYALAGWKVDNAWWRDALGRAVNPATNILMNLPHAATAYYLPFWTDADGNGLLDWWECRYFGSTGAATSSDDPDHDGWNNYFENRDHTDPLDASSYPTPPAIIHTPLAAVQTTPPPWTVTATITDNFSVEEAAVFWRTNDGPYVYAAMSPAGGDAYRAELNPDGGAAVTTVAYYVAAADLVLISDTPVYSFEAQYPILRIAPTNFGAVRLSRDGLDRPVTVANDGHGPMSWEAFALQPLLRDAMEKGTNGWTHAGDNDGWHLSGRRWASASNAWYCGSEPGSVYANGSYAALVSTSVLVGAGGMLTFRHWMSAEPDSGAYYWDGGVVRISTNDGASFSALAPLGGYPHFIVPNSESPFEPDTPCFGQNDWKEEWFDLSAYSGRTVRVAFVFGSDLYTVDEGWYIDDVWIGSGMTGSWLSLTGAVAGVAGARSEQNPFALKANALELPPQADVGGAVRVNTSCSWSRPSLIPFRLRRPAFVSSDCGPNGSVTPAAADLLDAESTSLVAAAAANCRIVSVTTNGIPAPASFGIGSTHYTVTLQNASSDIVLTARFARIWNIAVTVHGPGSSSPSGSFPLDEISTTNVRFQAEAGREIWNLLVDGAPQPAAWGLSAYALPVSAPSADRSILAAFGGPALTGLPVAVEAAWMRTYYPLEWDFDAIARQDTDGDGMEGWKEFVAGTDPTNSESVLNLVVPDHASVTVPEGGTAAFQVKLSTKPKGDLVVTATPASGDADITVAGGASLTFTPANWDLFQTVTLAAAEDNDDNACGTAVITCDCAGLTQAVVTATEADDDYTLTVTTGCGTVGKDPDAALYDHGARVILAATANDDYYFDGWSGDAAGHDNPISVIMDGDKRVTAAFSPIAPFVLPPSSIGKNALTARWKWVAGGAPEGELSVAEDAEFGRLVPGYEATYLLNSTDCAVTNLSSGRDYWYRVRRIVPGDGRSGWSEAMKARTGIWMPVFKWLLSDAPVSKGVVQEFALTNLSTGMGMLEAASSDPNAVKVVFKDAVATFRYRWDDTNATARVTLRVRHPLTGYEASYEAVLSRARGTIAVVDVGPLIRAGKRLTQDVTLENRTGRAVSGVRLRAWGLEQASWMVNRTGLDPASRAPIREIPCVWPPASQLVMRVVYKAAYRPQAESRPVSYRAWAILPPLNGLPPVNAGTAIARLGPYEGGELLKMPAVCNRLYTVFHSDDNGATWTLNTPLVRAAANYLMWLDTDETAPANRLYWVRDAGW